MHPNRCGRRSVTVLICHLIFAESVCQLASGEGAAQVLSDRDSIRPQRQGRGRHDGEQEDL